MSLISSIHCPSIHRVRRFKKHEGVDPIRIQVEDILDRFDCPVCICELQEPTITKCGHTFCKECIKEVINLKHDCPLCVAELESMEASTSKNYTLELLLNSLHERQESEMQKYIDSLTQNAIQKESQIIENDCGSELKSQIEKIFVSNLKQSFIKFQKYLSDTLSQRDGQVSALRKKYANIINGLDQSQIDSDEKVQQMTEERDQEIQRIIKRFNGAQDILMQQYDNHMKEVLPEPQLLPVRINVILYKTKGGQKVEIKDVLQVKPYETVDSLKNDIQQMYEQKQDPLVKFDIEKIVACGPLYMGSFDDIRGLQQNVPNTPNETGKTQVGLQNRVEILDMTFNFQQLGVTSQNTTILFEGDIVAESDKPLECVTLSYKKDDPKQTKYNYYSCKKCNINWVCEACMKGCHDEAEGHIILPHLLDHRPTWACCFCCKKGFCKIKNAKNKDTFVDK